MENKYLKLTNTVYKVLDFFPESDPLKHRAKDKALAIMDHLVLINQNSGWMSFQNEKTKVQLLEDIEILLGYFWIGKSQGWLNSVNFLIIANEYEKIKRELAPVIESTQKLPGIDNALRPKEGTQEIREPTLDNVVEKLTSDNFDASDRQKQILEFLSKNDKAQVMDLQTILPDITKRTIRRDLDGLLETGKIVRSGDFNQVFYSLRSDIR
ncbi:MAG: DeoR family transcriptional regulator [Candidatus Staskawiczbacteria bacterium]|nr:DeoR family transcriptional regulator [Candidatus Staskawiczbacteria bacterium]